jgi:hypothetical protein
MTSGAQKCEPCSSCHCSCPALWGACLPLLLPSSPCYCQAYTATARQPSSSQKFFPAFPGSLARQPHVPPAALHAVPRWLLGCRGIKQIIYGLNRLFLMPDTGRACQQQLPCPCTWVPARLPAAPAAGSCRTCHAHRCWTLGPSPAAKPPPHSWGAGEAASLVPPAPVLLQRTASTAQLAA